MNRVVLIKVKQLGLFRPTIIQYGDKTIISKGLDISELVRFWREELDLYDEIINLQFPKKIFDSVKQRTSSSLPTLREMFYQQDVNCILEEQK